MFTGIVQELGIVCKLERSGGFYRLGIRSDKVCEDAVIGDSVAVNGVCLTVAAKKSDVLNFDVMAETIRRTNLIELKDNDKVNLEGSLKANASLGGHFVLGHIDCLGRIKDIKKRSGEFTVRIDFNGAFSHLIVEKGSIAIDGVSLTIGRAGDNTLDVYLIPHTLKATTLDTRKSGDSVNLEFDIIGKYAARFGEVRGQSRISEEFLRDKGF